MDLFHSYYSFEGDYNEFDISIVLCIETTSFSHFLLSFFIILDSNSTAITKIENRFCFTKKLKYCFFVVTLDCLRVSGQPDFPFPILIILQNGGNVGKV